MLAPAIAFVAALVMTPVATDQTSPAVPQTQAASQVSEAAAPTDLEDIVVEGRRLEEATRSFINEVGSPARGRGLARWRDGVCVGVVNLRGETAQYTADRISTVAEDLGLRAGLPGCDPSIMVIATADAHAFTPRFVDMRPRLFIVGAGGMDLGHNALNRFKTVDRPVRWWNVSIPVDSDTGDIAVRLPGQAPPVTAIRAASRLSTQIVDDAKRVFVIIDVNKINGVNLQQLGDYLAMVSLAQINPDADTSGYASVLNLFSDPERTEGLTNWDMAYLQGLYATQRTRASDRASRTEIAASIIDVHHRMTAEREAAEDAEATPPQ